MNTLDEIKSIRWENRVKRYGFLQPKGIINEAETIPIEIAEVVTIKYDNVFWVMDYNLYDEKKTLELPGYFEKAFVIDKRWPLSVIDFFDKIIPKFKSLLTELKETDWKKEGREEKLKVFIRYVNMLFSIQKYYQIAVPLTNYCESMLSDFPEIIESCSYPYKELELSTISRSKDYSWIKTTYNVVEQVNDEDLSHAIMHMKRPAIKVPKKIEHYVVGMQVGIYARNRMKELSQMLWYHVEHLARSMAKDLKISRDDFFCLTYREVIRAYETNKLPDYKKRKEGFTIGILDNKEVILTGKENAAMMEFLNNVPDEGNLNGTTACKGYAKGKARIIMNIKDFKKLGDGDILVTPMTTPEFVVIMKKAAAIITDEGGLSCHAAIVSRELGKPCIIGTKHATKLLKDGDIIEVDADKGIVRKLK